MKKKGFEKGGEKFNPTRVEPRRTHLPKLLARRIEEGKYSKRRREIKDVSTSKGYVQRRLEGVVEM